IEQRNSVRTTRSTVGTMTEICDHMKVLWPHLAQLHCRGCGQPVRKDSPQEVWSKVQSPKSKVEERASEVLVTFDLPLSDKLSLASSRSITISPLLITRSDWRKLRSSRGAPARARSPSGTWQIFAKCAACRWMCHLPNYRARTSAWSLMAIRTTESTRIIVG